MPFCDRLKSCRENSRYKQRQVAEYIGVSLRTYQGYEAGRSEPTIVRLIALADLFDVSLDYLMGRADQP